MREHDEIRQVMEDYYSFWFGVNDVYETWAKKRGLTCNALFTLYVIGAHPEECTQRLICDQLLLPKQTVGAILDAFQKKGYLERKPMERDRRNKCLKFTPKGREYAEAVLGGLDQFEEKALGGMTREERQAMVKGCMAFLRQLTFGLEEDRTNEKHPSAGDS